MATEMEDVRMTVALAGRLVAVSRTKNRPGCQGFRLKFLEFLTWSLGHFQVSDGGTCMLIFMFLARAKHRGSPSRGKDLLTTEEGGREGGGGFEGERAPSRA